MFTKDEFDFTRFRAIASRDSAVLEAHLDPLERQFLDRRIGEGPDPPIQVDDLVAGFALGRVPVGLRVGLEIRFGDPLLGRRPSPAEGVSEVADLDVGHVLDDAYEIRAGGRAGHSEVALAEAVQFPQQRLAAGLEVVTKRGLKRSQIAHGDSLDRQVSLSSDPDAGASSTRICRRQ